MIFATLTLSECFDCFNSNRLNVQHGAVALHTCGHKSPLTELHKTCIQPFYGMNLKKKYLPVRTRFQL